MIYVMLAVRDAKSEVFGRPFFMTTVGQAIRSFEDEVKTDREDNMMFKHPADFALYRLGSYNDQDGSCESITPQLLMQGNEVVQLQLRERGVSVVK